MTHLSITILLCFTLLVLSGCKKNEFQPQQSQAPQSLKLVPRLQAELAPDRISPRFGTLIQELKDEEDNHPECRILRSPGPYPNESVFLNTLSIQQDCMELNFSYSGGCGQHLFALTWDGQWISTNEGIVHLKLKHYAGGDMCESWVTESRSWDISPLTSPNRNLSRVVINIDYWSGGQQSITYVY